MIRKALSGLFTALFFLSNCALVHAAESNLWTDRQKHRRRPALVTQIASLPQRQLLSPAGPVIKPLDLSSVSRRAVPAGIPAGAARFLRAVPLNRVSIKDVSVSRDGRGEKPLVLLIQDIHLNHEAQLNIAETLLALNEEAAGAGNEPLLVGVEGAFRSFDFSRFRRYDDLTLRQSVANVFLERNKIAAPSYAGLAALELATRFEGIDDPAHYEANVAAYQNALPVREAIRSTLERKKRELSAQKLKTFNPALLAFDARRTAHESSPTDLGDYATFLSREADRLQLAGADDFELERFLTAFAMERALDFAKVETERARVVEKLAERLSETDVDRLVALSLAHRAGTIGYAAYYNEIRAAIRSASIALSDTPAFDAYIRYVLLADAIDAERLIAAVRALEDRVASHLIRSDEERALLAAFRELELISRLLDFALTPQEWDEYRHARTATLPVGSFEDFYEAADVRSDRMVERLLENANARTAVAVAIAGGFHTPLLTRRLKERGVSYAVLQPKVTRFESGTGTDYLSIFAREKTPLDHLFRGEKLFLAPFELQAGAFHPADDVLEAVFAGLTQNKTQTTLRCTDGHALDALLNPNRPANEKEGELRFDVPGWPSLLVRPTSLASKIRISFEEFGAAIHSIFVGQHGEDQTEKEWRERTWGHRAMSAGSILGAGMGWAAGVLIGMELADASLPGQMVSAGLPLVLSAIGFVLGQTSVHTLYLMGSDRYGWARLTLPPSGALSEDEIRYMSAVVATLEGREGLSFLASDSEIGAVDRDDLIERYVSYHDAFLRLSQQEFIRGPIRVNPARRLIYDKLIVPLSETALERFGNAKTLLDRRMTALRKRERKSSITSLGLTEAEYELISATFEEINARDPDNAIADASGNLGQRLIDRSPASLDPDEVELFFRAPQFLRSYMGPAESKLRTQAPGLWLRYFHPDTGAWNTLQQFSGYAPVEPEFVLDFAEWIVAQPNQTDIFRILLSVASNQTRFLNIVDGDAIAPEFPALASYLVLARNPELGERQLKGFVESRNERVAPNDPGMTVGQDNPNPIVVLNGLMADVALRSSTPSPAYDDPESRQRLEAAVAALNRWTRQHLPADAGLQELQEEIDTVVDSAMEPSEKSDSYSPRTMGWEEAGNLSPEEFRSALQSRIALRDGAVFSVFSFANGRITQDNNALMGMPEEYRAIVRVLEGVLNAVLGISSGAEWKEIPLWYGMGYHEFRKGPAAELTGSAVLSRPARTYFLSPPGQAALAAYLDSDFVRDMVQVLGNKRGETIDLADAAGEFLEAVHAYETANSSKKLKSALWTLAQTAKFAKAFDLGRVKIYSGRDQKWYLDEKSPISKLNPEKTPFVVLDAPGIDTYSDFERHVMTNDVRNQFLIFKRAYVLNGRTYIVAARSGLIELHYTSQQYSQIAGQITFERQEGALGFLEDDELRLNWYVKPALELMHEWSPRASMEVERLLKRGALETVPESPESRSLIADLHVRVGVVYDPWGARIVRRNGRLAYDQDPAQLRLDPSRYPMFALQGMILAGSIDKRDRPAHAGKKVVLPKKSLDPELLDRRDKLPDAVTASILDPLFALANRIPFVGPAIYGFLTVVVASVWETEAFQDAGTSALPTLLASLGLDPSIALAVGGVWAVIGFSFAHTIVEWLQGKREGLGRRFLVRSALGVAFTLPFVVNASFLPGLSATVVTLPFVDWSLSGAAVIAIGLHSAYNLAALIFRRFPATRTFALKWMPLASILSDDAGDNPLAPVATHRVPEDDEDPAAYLQEAMPKLLAEGEQIQSIALHYDKSTFGTMYKVVTDRRTLAVKVAMREDYSMFDIFSGNLALDAALFDSVYGGRREAPFSAPGIRLATYAGKITTDQGQPILVAQEFIDDAIQVGQWIKTASAEDLLDQALKIITALSFFRDKGFTLFDAQTTNFLLTENGTVLTPVDYGGYDVVTEESKKLKYVPWLVQSMFDSAFDVMGRDPMSGEIRNKLVTHYDSIRNHDLKPKEEESRQEYLSKTPQDPPAPGTFWSGIGTAVLLFALSASFFFSNLRPLGAEERQVLKDVSRSAAASERLKESLPPVRDQDVGSLSMSRDQLMRELAADEDRSATDWAFRSLLLGQPDTGRYSVERLDDGSAAFDSSSDVSLVLLDPKATAVPAAELSRGRKDGSITVLYVGPDFQQPINDPGVRVLRYSAENLSLDRLASEGVTVSATTRIRVRVEKDAIPVAGVAPYLESIESVARDNVRMVVSVATSRGTVLVPVVARELTRMVEFEAVVRRLLDTQA